MTMTSVNETRQADPSRRRPAGAAASRLRWAVALAAAILVADVRAARASDDAAQPPPKPAAPAASVAPSAPAAPATAAGPATRPAAAEPAQANQVVSLDALGPDRKVQLLVGRSLVLKTSARIKNVSFSQPDIAADNELDPTTVLLSARKAGITQLVLWDEKDRTQIVDVVVDADLNVLGDQLKKTFPGASIELSNANGTIVLRGRVPNLQIAEQATALVGSYGKALNLLELAGGQQVMLQVRFAEVSRSADLQLGFNAFASDGRFQAGYIKGPGVDPIGAIAGNQKGTINPAVSIFGGGQIGSTALEVFVQAMRTNNLLRVLAEPNLTAISGQDASFLAGGEFPIPVPQAGGGATAITVEYKQFGVRLNFLPVVLGDGRIRLKVAPEVSDLDFSRSVSFNGFTIPALTKRNVVTTIELNEGQTFSVAGLLNNRVTATNDVVPLLGDLPVLGALFRSVRYERNETELVVLVTPHLVEGMNPSQVPPLPGEHWTFPTENDLFWRQYLGGPAPDPKAPTTQPAPVTFHGPYGFTPVEK
jgi:pilus assembly protein CpaC